MGVRDSCMPCHRINEKLYYKAAKPLFKMPEFSPSMVHPTTDTPALDLNNTTAKKLDFEGSDTQMNRKRLKIEALSESQ